VPGTLDSEIAGEAIWALDEGRWNTATGNDSQIIAISLRQSPGGYGKWLKQWSEWQDSNLRPLLPESSALPG
jgi:hypothetical protein